MTFDASLISDYSLLAYGHEKPQVTAVLKKDLADFQVDEVLGFEFTGSGHHWCLQIRKSDCTTLDIATRLAETQGVKVADIGYAGMKDKRGICTQWFSVPIKAGHDLAPSTIEDEKACIVDVRKNDRKIRIGSHKANAFRIRLHELQGPERELRERVEKIAAYGVPNYFGYQRFGRNMQNVATALEYFSGFENSSKLRKGKSLKKSMLISASRSFLFNKILSHRVMDLSWARILDGEVLNLDGTSRFFLPDTSKPAACEPVGVEGRPEAIESEVLIERLHQLDIHPTGQLFGNKDPKDKYQPGGEVAMLEERVLSQYPELCSGILRTGVLQSRRALRLIPRNISFRMLGTASAELEFTLAAGGYATTLMRELVQTREPSGTGLDSDAHGSWH